MLKPHPTAVDKYDSTRLTKERNMIDRMIDRLIATIGKEAVLFEKFLDLLERQQKMLIANDLEGLSLISETMRERTIENRLLDQQRERLVAEIKEANSLEGDVNVSRLLEIVDEQRADRLRELRQTIYALHDKISDTRNRNALLINRSREYIGRTMEMLAQIEGSDGIYHATGAGSYDHQAIAIDRRA